ncbi:hypothetical protein ABZP36_002637 [Zizania latifolia]
MRRPPCMVDPRRSMDHGLPRAADPLAHRVDRAPERPHASPSSSFPLAPSSASGLVAVRRLPRDVGFSGVWCDAGRREEPLNHKQPSVKLH